MRVTKIVIKKNICKSLKSKELTLFKDVGLNFLCQAIKSFKFYTVLFKNFCLVARLGYHSVKSGSPSTSASYHPPESLHPDGFLALHFGHTI